MAFFRADITTYQALENIWLSGVIPEIFSAIKRQRSLSPKIFHKKVRLRINLAIR